MVLFCIITIFIIIPVIESETEGIPTETTTEKEIEETLIETEIENTTESEIEEVTLQNTKANNTIKTKILINFFIALLL